MRAWLRNWDWGAVIEVNQKLCEKANYYHKVGTGGQKTKTFWEETNRKALTLEGMVMVCKTAHFAEPFINLNGNTFAAIALDVCRNYKPITCNKAEFEEAICAIVAGTTQGQEKILLATESKKHESQKKDFEKEIEA